jgi:hypothetical protein
MTSSRVAGLWELWAPPLDPPVPGGLPRDLAEQAAAAGDCPHCVAAMLWEAYAGMLPPSPAVASMSTGAQSVSYAAQGGGSEAGLAMARADWHRLMCTGTLSSVPLRVAPADDDFLYLQELPGWWEA